MIDALLSMPFWIYLATAIIIGVILFRLICKFIVKNVKKAPQINTEIKYSNNTFWTKFLHTITSINLICGIIIGLYVWNYINNFIGTIIGITIILITMLTTSGIMVFVEMSENIAESKKEMTKQRENTDKILEILCNKK